MLKVDPITLEVLTMNYTASSKIKQRVSELRGKFDSLKDFNNWLLEVMSEFSDLPADTRFPGFFSSLYDHALLTSAIAVAIALDLRRKGVEFGAEYEGQFSELLKNEKGLIEIVRSASLLHDIGKQPPEEHYKRTRDSVEELLKIVGFWGIARDLAECACRHHYRMGLEEEYKPRTKLEWVIALADKIAVVDRAVLIERDRELAQCLDWLSSKLGQSLGWEDKRNLGEFIEYLNGKREKLSETRIMPIEIEEIQKLDRLVFNPKEVFGFEPKIGLLCLEIAGIQKYVTASDFRKYVSGASSLLENVLTEVRDDLSNRFCPECVIYAKGGSLLAIVPAGYYEEIKNKIREKFKKRTSLASPKLPPLKFFEYSLSELKYGPRVVQESNLVLKRNFGSCVSRTLSYLEVEESLENAISIPVGKNCECCYEYPEKHVWEDPDKELKICERCNLVLNEYKNTKEKILFLLDLENLLVESELKNEFWNKLVSRFQERIRNSKIASELDFKGVRRLTFRLVNTWDHLGRQHFSPMGGEEGNYDVAFVKGDGDNFGKIKESASSPTIFREISKLFESIIEGSIIEGFVEILLRELKILSSFIGEKSDRSEYLIEIPFDVVFIGGDDFLILMDSAFVFAFLEKFRENVQRLLGERKEKYDKELMQRLSVFPLGVSIGVAVVKNRIPIKSTFSVLEYMVKKAKERSKEEATGRRFGSEIYIYMQKFDQIPTKEEIEALERKQKCESTKNGSNERFTSFPMSGKEFVEFMDHIKFFVEREISPNWIKRVFGTEKPESTADACVNFLFKMARTDKESEEFKALAKLYEVHEKFEIKEGFRYKHIDLAESLRILTEKIDQNVEEAELRKRIKKILLGD